MGGFNTLISSILATVADPLTDSLQETVSHYAYADATVDSYNKTDWSGVTPTSRKGIVSRKSTVVQRMSGVGAGELVAVRYSLVFPRPVAVDPRDRFVLPGSVEGPIVDVIGVLDPATSVVYATEVLFG